MMNVPKSFISGWGCLAQSTSHFPSSYAHELNIRSRLVTWLGKLTSFDPDQIPPRRVQSVRDADDDLGDIDSVQDVHGGAKQVLTYVNEACASPRAAWKPTR